MIGLQDIKGFIFLVVYVTPTPLPQPCFSMRLSEYQICSVVIMTSTVKLSAHCMNDGVEGSWLA